MPSIFTVLCSLPLLIYLIFFAFGGVCMYMFTEAFMEKVGINFGNRAIYLISSLIFFLLAHALLLNLDRLLCRP